MIIRLSVLNLMHKIRCKTCPFVKMFQCRSSSKIKNNKIIKLGNLTVSVGYNHSTFKSVYMTMVPFLSTTPRGHYRITNKGIILLLFLTMLLFCIQLFLKNGYIEDRSVSSQISKSNWTEWSQWRCTSSKWAVPVFITHASLNYDCIRVTLQPNYSKHFKKRKSC